MVLVAGATALACGGGEEEAREIGTDTVEEWSLSAEPLLEIGVVEGEEPYQLHQASGSVRLADGRVVVLNQGSDQLRFFGPEGTHLRSVGGPGEGPGEFQRPTRIRLTSPDTLRVWDARLHRFSWFDTAGTFVRTEAVELGGEEPFPLEVWLEGRNLVDGPLAPGERGGVAAALAAAPPVSEAPVRFVRVTAQGRLWSTPGLPPREGPVGWTVREPDGSILARIRTPTRFELHHVGPDFVTGRWRGEMDVNRIRIYALEKPEDSPPAPGLQELRMAGPGPTPPGRVAEEAPDLLREAVRSLAMSQEVHYARSYTYTRAVDSLDVELPGSIRADVLRADDRGWLALLEDTESGALCALGFGFTTPMGWTPGSVLCP